MANPIAVPGTVVPSGSLTTPGGAQGIQGPTAVSTDAGNLAVLGSDNLISVPQSSITLMRLRSFNAIGNPTFEVDQVNIGNTVANANAKIIDRWSCLTSLGVSAGQQSVAAGINLPGTNFSLTRSFFRVTLTTAKPSLAAGDYLSVAQSIEGPQWRELQNDVHSFQVLVRSSVANLIIGVAIRDQATTRSLTNTLTLGAANTWTLLSLPNLPLWPSAGTYFNTPGNVGYLLSISLATGSTYLSPANGTWQTGNFTGAVGQSNFASSPLNSTFDIAYASHEPGSVCSTPMDLDFQSNWRSCQRYYQKSSPYPNKFPTAGDWMQIGQFVSLTTARSGVIFPVELAKAPTVTLADLTPTLNSVYLDGVSAAAAVASTGSNQRRISQINLSTSQASTANLNPVLGSWQADTGW